MKIAFVTTFAAALTAVVAAGALQASVPNSDGAAATSAKARLALVRRAPLTIRGTSFASRERVKLILASKKRITKMFYATAGGSFVIRFPGVRVDRCEGFAAFAIGARGSRAALGLPNVYCPPPPR